MIRLVFDRGLVLQLLRLPPERAGFWNRAIDSFAVPWGADCGSGPRLHVHVVDPSILIAWDTFLEQAALVALQHGCAKRFLHLTPLWNIEPTITIKDVCVTFFARLTNGQKGLCGRIAANSFHINRHTIVGDA